MKLQFKHQKFQEEAAKAVTDVFRGQPYITPTHLIDQGTIGGYGVIKAIGEIGWNNALITPSLGKEQILQNINEVQERNDIIPSENLEGTYNLTIEMETGVGKTYTYIKTIHELNKLYGWSKYIVIVPSVAIREGVKKTFDITQEHFYREYGKHIISFIYDSSKLYEIDDFASDNNISVMIINAQAFNAKGKDSRRISMKLDEFRSRRPIDIIAKTNPIVIIDEPQSVEGKQTKQKIKEFNPLMILRYSATHKKDSLYNMVYRLDAVDAYNQKLVKRIAVKGINESGTTASEGFVYLEVINVSNENPTATITFDFRGKSSVRHITRTVNEGYDLYEQSGRLEKYKNNFIVSRIDGNDNSIEFANGIKMFAGDVIGKSNEDEVRRIQIRETILTHLEKERSLFQKGIKVLSLFFIDEVDHYRKYDAAGQKLNGDFARIFEEEYSRAVDALVLNPGEEKYREYLSKIKATSTHSGYFSIDKAGRMVNASIGNKKEQTSDDISAYELIMKNKELLLDLDPIKSPVRFIFSHSALREGWDNPNVFQICTLKQSSSDVRKRQEVGRGLRLCVNQQGERMDENFLGSQVQDINELTVVASESYETFAKELQDELAQAITNKIQAITTDFLINKKLKNEKGEVITLDSSSAQKLYNSLIRNNYIDDDGKITEVYHKDIEEDALNFGPAYTEYSEAIKRLLTSVYDPSTITIKDARNDNVELKIDQEKFASEEFNNLWNRINSKSYYVVDFDTEELIEKAIKTLDKKLTVPKIHYKVEMGVLNRIKSKDALENGEAFEKQFSREYSGNVSDHSSVKYDLIGKLVEQTNLTRKVIIRILSGILPETFDLFKNNPEEFIIRAGNIINDEKATSIIQHITYNMLDEKFSSDIFTAPLLKGKLDKNVIRTKKHLFDYLLYDSDGEKKFSQELDIADEVALYVKLPSGFFISTPVGNYNPDWAIAFKEGSVKHIYFVAETKGSLRSMNLRDIEQAKIHCAEQHFKKLSTNNIKYSVVKSFSDLMDKVRK